MAQEYKTWKLKENVRERAGKIETSTAIIVMKGNRKAVVQQWQMTPVIAPIDTETLDLYRITVRTPILRFSDKI